ncbi:MAG: hypothetical protein LBB54_06445 [Cellulomonadaceae bacterium]|jgi:hypothetical protein|nr:hypothetical protein [Cellulomonadaceae bacterium]
MFAKSVVWKKSVLWGARTGLITALVTLIFAWWVSVRWLNFTLSVLVIVSTLSFFCAIFGYVTKRLLLVVIGLAVCAIFAPTGFGYLGNVVTLAISIYLLTSLIRKNRHPAKDEK